MLKIGGLLVMIVLIAYAIKKVIDNSNSQSSNDGSGWNPFGDTTTTPQTSGSGTSDNPFDMTFDFNANDFPFPDTGTSTIMNKDTFVYFWAQAISQFESGGKADAFNFRNNNPGNIRDSHGNFIKYATMDDGWQALYDDLNAKLRKYPNYSLVNYMARYLGNPDPLNPQVTNQGDPFAYAQFIVNWFSSQGYQLASAINTVPNEVVA